MRHAVIIADGLDLSLSQIKKHIKNQYVIVLDGAFEKVRYLGSKIDALLGDFDSISKELLEEANAMSVDVLYAPNQNYTDLEKGIFHADKFNCGQIDIFGATGGRLDHTLHNIRLLSRFYRKNRLINLFTLTEKLFLMKNESISLKCEIGAGIAILGAPIATVTTRGLQYDMQNIKLSYEGQDSVCNRVEENEVYIEITGAAIIIVNLL